ncbi:hypothetical protein LCGC14_0672770, partial [marine sediment metagenome]
LESLLGNLSDIEGKPRKFDSARDDAIEDLENLTQWLKRDGFPPDVRKAIEEHQSDL